MNLISRILRYLFSICDYASERRCRHHSANKLADSRGIEDAIFDEARICGARGSSLGIWDSLLRPATQHIIAVISAIFNYCLYWRFEMKRLEGAFSMRHARTVFPLVQSSPTRRAAPFDEFFLDFPISHFPSPPFPFITWHDARSIINPSSQTPRRLH